MIGWDENNVYTRKAVTIAMCDKDAGRCAEVHGVSERSQ